MMATKKKLEHPFRARQYQSIGDLGIGEGEEPVPFTYDDISDAVEESAGKAGDGSALVATYKLVKVERLKVVKTTDVVSVKE